jgi:hypothetical protein
VCPCSAADQGELATGLRVPMTTPIHSGDRADDAIYAAELAVAQS